MKINSKEDIIKYFNNGCKKKVFIGVENEKFIFDLASNTRATYDQLKKILIYLKKFGWQEIYEESNIIGLNKNEQSITLEPGNQIELAGGLCQNIHEVCSESYVFQKQLDEACEHHGLKTISIGYDPITDLKDVPDNPKKRYKIMTKEMPKNGKLSLEMMYQTCGTQINLDYTSEKDFKKKFKLSSFLVPLSTAIFAKSRSIAGAKVYTHSRQKIIDACFALGMRFREELDLQLEDDTYVPTRCFNEFRNPTGTSNINSNISASKEKSILSCIWTGGYGYGNTAYKDNQTKTSFVSSLITADDPEDMSVFESFVQISRELQKEAMNLAERDGASATYLDNDGFTRYSHFDDNNIIACIFEILFS